MQRTVNLELQLCHIAANISVILSFIRPVRFVSLKYDNRSKFTVADLELFFTQQLTVEELVSVELHAVYSHNV